MFDSIKSLTKTTFNENCEEITKDMVPDTSFFRKMLIKFKRIISILLKIKLGQKGTSLEQIIEQELTKLFSSYF